MKLRYVGPAGGGEGGWHGAALEEVGEMGKVAADAEAVGLKEDSGAAAGGVASSS